MLSLGSSILFSGYPSIRQHGIKPTFDDLNCKGYILPYSNFTMKSIIPKKTPRKSLSRRTKT
jgi:hypothetical protein